jgi:hypothetical protein
MMSQIELQLPPEIQERAEQIAKESNRSLEDVLLEGLSLLFGQLNQISPDNLNAYSDEQLWAVVHQRLAWPQESRLRELSALGKRGQITEREKLELEELITVVDHTTLLRSKALLLLKERGHDIDKLFSMGL